MRRNGVIANLLCFSLFSLSLHCSTRGDEALVGRVTVNAID